MPVPELPTEVIILIIDYLPRAHIVRLLTVNRHWRNVITARLYRTICIRSVQEQYEYRNLFNETRRRRLPRQSRLGLQLQQQHQGEKQEEEEEEQSLRQADNQQKQSPSDDGSSNNNNNNTNGFYSSENYGLYVRELDLSIPYRGKDITDSLLYDLALDCPNLEVLNLYNCHRITTVAVQRVLRQCKKVKHLYLSMATGIDARCLQQQEQQQQQPSSSTFLIPSPLRQRRLQRRRQLQQEREKDSTSSSASSSIEQLELQTLNIFGLAHFFSRYRPATVLASLKTLKAGHYLDRQTIQLMNHLQHVSLDGMDPGHITLLLERNQDLRSIRLVRCQLLYPPLLNQLMTQKHLTTLELHRCKLPVIMQQEANDSYSGTPNEGNVDYGHRSDGDGYDDRMMTLLLPKPLHDHPTAITMTPCLNGDDYNHYYYESMQRLEFKYMDVPTIQQIVEHCSDRLTSFTGPYNTTDAVLDTLRTQCPRLKRLSLVTRGTRTQKSGYGNAAGHISLDCLQRTLQTYTSTLVYLELSIPPPQPAATMVERVLLQWPNPNLQVLILRFQVSLLLLQNLARLYPSLRVLYIASTPESLSEAEVDQYLLGHDKLQHLEALMLYDRRISDSSTTTTTTTEPGDDRRRNYLALKNYYDYWSLRKEIW